MSVSSPDLRLLLQSVVSKFNWREPLKHALETTAQGNAFICAKSNTAGRIFKY